MKLFNKCPVCGSTIEYSALIQYSNVYKVLQNGELSKNRIRKEDNGSMECGYYSCTNQDCDYATDCELRVVNHTGIELEYMDGKIYYHNLNDEDDVKARY